MANLDDLGFSSLTNKSTDESLEVLRQIRLARRTPSKPAKVSMPKKSKAKDSDLTTEQVTDLLKLLGAL